MAARIGRVVVAVFSGVVLGVTGIGVVGGQAASASLSPGVRLSAAARYGIVPVRSSAVRPALDQASIPCVVECVAIHMSYFDGPVVSNAAVVGVFWGSGTYTAGEGFGGGMPGFYNTVGSSTWFEDLSEYSTAGLANSTGQTIGPANSTTEVQLSPALANDGAKITDAEEQAELVADFNNGSLPKPTLDSRGYVNTVYALYMPNGKKLIDPSGDQGGVVWCAYHNTVSYNGLDVPYMVLPADVPGSGYASGCGVTGSNQGDFTGYVSHELAESVTDPAIGLDTQSTYTYPAAWASNSYSVGEVADACDSNASNSEAQVGGYWVQALWSNQANACLLPTTFPLNITAPSPTITYTGAIPTLTPTYSGFQGGDTASSLTTPATCTTTATSASPVGTYPVTCSGAVDANYAFTYVTGTLTIGPATPSVPTITNIPVSGVVGGGFNAQVATSGDGTTSVTTSTPGVCTVSGFAVTYVGAGQCTLTAHVAQGTDYAAADGTAQSLTVGAFIPLNITAPSPTITYTGAIPTLTPTYSGFQGGDTASSLTTQATCTTTATSTSPVGTYPVTCSGAVDAKYAITYVTGTLTIMRATPSAPSITDLPASGSIGGGFNAQVATTGDGTTSVTTSTPGVCTVSGSAVTYVGAGQCTLTAHVTQGTDYAAADGTAQSFSVGATFLLHITAPSPTITYTSAIPTLTPTYSGFQGGDTASSLTTQPTCTTTATSTSGVGTYPVTCSGAVDAKYAITYVTGTLTLVPANPSAPSITNLPVSGVMGGGFNAQVATTGDGATSVTTSTPAVCTVSGSAVTYVGAGQCTLTAHVAQGTDYAAADGIAQSLSVGVVTWAAPAAISFGTKLGAKQLDAKSSVPGTFSYTPSTGTVLGAGSHTLSTTFTPVDLVHYSPETYTVTLLVNKANPKITWAKPAPITYPAPISGTQLAATSSVPGTFSYNPAAGTVLAAGSHSLVATFTPADAADYNTVTAKAVQVVEKAPTTTVLTVTSPVVYGAEGGAGLSVHVTPAAGGAFSGGKVTFKATSSGGTATTLCTVTLQVLGGTSGTGACTLSGTKLPVGSYTVQATYTATTDFAASSASAPLSVQPAAAMLWAARTAFDWAPL